MRRTGCAPGSRARPRPAAPPSPTGPRLRPPGPAPRARRLQFGADPSEARSVVDGLTPPLVRMVDALDGTRPRARVLAEAVGRRRGARPPPRACSHACTPTGLLVAARAARGPGRAPWSSCTARGRVAGRVACLLAAAGRGRVLVEAAGTVVRDDIGTGLLAGDVGRPAVRAAAEVARAVAAGPRRPATAARRRLAARARPRRPRRRAPAPTRSSPRSSHRRRAHLAVGVDRRRLAARSGRSSARGARPACGARTSRRAAADPAWPRLAAELAGRRARPCRWPSPRRSRAVAAGRCSRMLDAGPPVPARRPPGVARRRPASRPAWGELDPRAAPRVAGLRVRRPRGAGSPGGPTRGGPSARPSRCGGAGVDGAAPT